MPHDLNAKQTQQVTPAVIPPVFIGQDPSGRIGSLNVSGPTVTATNGFFEDLGSIRSVVGTAKRRGIDAYQAITATLRGQTVLPAG
jgi:hypothetical protein